MCGFWFWLGQCGRLNRSIGIDFGPVFELETDLPTPSHIKFLAMLTNGFDVADVFAGGWDVSNADDGDVETLGFCQGAQVEAQARPWIVAQVVFIVAQPFKAIAPVNHKAGWLAVDQERMASDVRVTRSYVALGIDAMRVR